MRRRILTAIVVVAAVVVVGFGVPLGIAVQQLYRNEAVVRLEREAARAGAQVPSTFSTSSDPVELPEPDVHTRVGVYSPDGTRLLGAGPDRGGAQVVEAAKGRIAESDGGPLIVATPLSTDERVFAVVRAELPADAIADRVHRVWLLMCALGAALLAVAAVVGRALSGRIARPVADLALASEQLGQGDFTVRLARSGIAELDAAADNLGVTAERLGRLIQRERAFSADASHQLRTPLTGIRLHLESALATPSVDPQAAMSTALGEVDRLESTIDDLLTLARDVDTGRAQIDLHEVLGAIERTWHGRLAALGRPLRVDVGVGAETAYASPGAVAQILDVLVSNAAEHGRGVIRLSSHQVGGGVAIDVSDDGQVTADVNRIFERRSAGGHGIGLALARSLAEVEGARLRLQATGPPVIFRLTLRLGEAVLSRAADP